LSGRVCYLQRSGDALASVRLVGVRSDDAWRPRRGSEEASALHDARQAAAWISERTADRKVAYLCLDVDGSNCRWLTSPTGDPLVLAAAMQGEGSNGWAGPSLSESSIQPLNGEAGGAPKKRRKDQGEAEAAHPVGQRRSVLAVPDSLARVAIDALDERGVEVLRAGSLWHAMAQAWDPSSPVLRHEPGRDGEIAAASPVTAVVMMDPSGRLLWAWSRDGVLLAGGAMFVPVQGDGGPRAGKAEVGRLVSDWLAWSVQLGETPGRIICITPKLAGGDMAEQEFGTAVGRAWAGASVDLVVHEDPIGATLSRLAMAEVAPGEGPGADLVSLNRRPRRVHRWMYLWSALAIGLGAAAVLAVGVKAWGGASAASRRAKDVTDQTRKAVLEAVPPPQNDPVLVATAESNPRRYIEERLAAERAKRNVRTGLPPARPILPELENLSLMLGTDGIELEEIRLSESLIQVHVYVPETKVAEDMVDALGRLDNDHCVWTIQYPTGTKNNLKLFWLDGTWKDKAAGGGGGGGTGGRP
jgi:hypothetical protein